MKRSTELKTSVILIINLLFARGFRRETEGGENLVFGWDKIGLIVYTLEFRHIYQTRPPPC